MKLPIYSGQRPSVIPTREPTMAHSPGPSHVTTDSPTLNPARHLETTSSFLRNKCPQCSNPVQENSLVFHTLRNKAVQFSITTGKQHSPYNNIISHRKTFSILNPIKGTIPFFSILNTSGRTCFPLCRGH